jgi:GTPase SAR1 family protein
MALNALDASHRFLERLYEDRIQQDYDAVIPVIGDEGVGKSTYILQLMTMYQNIRGSDGTPESVLDKVVWGGRDELKKAVANRPQEEIICHMDAARVLFSKDAMVGEQREIQKDLLDMRMKNNVFFLGYQDWDIIPSMIKKRRAKFAFVIPERGVVRGYNRDSLDKRYKNGRWPKQDMPDKFPSLEGTELWERFEQTDLEKKRERISTDDGSDGDSSPETPKEIAADIRETVGVESYIQEINNGAQTVLDRVGIAADYDIGKEKSKQVKRVLMRDIDEREVL